MQLSSEQEASIEISIAHLQAENQRLSKVQALTLALASATDLAELQEAILIGLVERLGFAHAAMGIYCGANQTVANWLRHGEGAPMPTHHTATLSVLVEGDTARSESVRLSPIAEAMQKLVPLWVSDGLPPTDDVSLNQGLALGHSYQVLPLMLENEPVGVLLVAVEREQGQADRLLLKLLAEHIGASLGGLQRTIEQTKHIAIQEERNRIAADIHDPVNQGLFGVAYGLNACAEMLPDELEAARVVKEHLGELQPMVFDALQQICSVIMDFLPSDLNRDRFINTLHKQLTALSLGRSIQLSTTVTPQFNGWSLEYRQQLMLITHEAISNAAKHAEAHAVSVQLRAYGTNLILAISDDGIGFEPESATYRPGLGIDSMRQRVEGLGGLLTLTSSRGQGTYLQAQIPLP